MKLNFNLKFCADCEEVFENGHTQNCPACGSKSTDYISRWVPPMFWRGGNTDDTVRLKVRCSALQEEPPRVFLSAPGVSDDCSSMAIDRELELVQAQQAQSFNAGYECGKEAGIRSEARKVDSLSGVIVEKLLSIVKGCYRPHAGASSNVETQVDKSTVKRSGDQPAGWNANSKGLYQDKQ